MASAKAPEPTPEVAPAESGETEDEVNPWAVSGNVDYAKLVRSILSCA